MSLKEGLALALAAAGQDFYRRGWVLGTSGNFSAVVESVPPRILITPSGASKGGLQPSDFLLIDNETRVLEGAGHPSAETALHTVIYEVRKARSVLHTHSVWSTLLSDRFAPMGEVVIEGFEMLKGLSGITTHQHAERIPILENSQDYMALRREVKDVLTARPEAHAFLLRRHGLYTWGSDVAQARRHVEILEFLFEVLARTL